MSLARADDFDVVPAWLELDEPPATVPAIWSAVADAVASRDVDELMARAALLGLPAARVGEAAGSLGVTRVPLGAADARDGTGLVVVDLSALWAGPLCGDLLAGAGASVIKVESTERPDGARRGPRGFFDLLNGRKRSVALDLRSNEGIATLRALVRRADVVVEASRPRALEQFGIRAAVEVAGGGPQIWVSITGYGRQGEGAGRVAFGDDAAAGGGLVVWHAGTAAHVLCRRRRRPDHWARRGAGVPRRAGVGRALAARRLDGRRVRRGSSGPTLPTRAGLSVAPPRARPTARPAPALGADTMQVLAELGLRI